MRKFKIIIYLFILALIISWFLLPSTLFINDSMKVLDIASPDKKYRVSIYRTKIISPYSFFKYLKDENYYFVLHDAKGGEVFKPSLFYGASEMAVYDSIEFKYGKVKVLFYPGEEGYEDFEIN